MALPIAHATAGYLLHRLDRRRTAFGGWPRAFAYMAIANLPDADFLVGFIAGRPGAFHRGVSHTLLAALLFGGAMGMLTRWYLRDRWLLATAMFAAVYASHLLLDALTIDARGPAGAQFFWPLSDAYFIAPVTVFTEILIDGNSRAGFLRTVVNWPTLVVIAREAMIAVVAITSFNVVDQWAAGATPARNVGTLDAEPAEEDLA